MRGSGDVADYAESFILGKHLGHVGVIPVLACRGRETWRSNFLVPLEGLRDFLPSLSSASASVTLVSHQVVYPAAPNSRRSNLLIHASQIEISGEYTR